MRDVTPGSALASGAVAINDRGEVLGTHGGSVFLWTRDGTIVELGRINNSDTAAVDLNERGVAVGY
jgi:hypothetical protein